MRNEETQESGKKLSDPGKNIIQQPTISLPKGGGAIRGIGEKFAANPVTGTGSMTVPIATSPGRSGFGPQLSLSYDSGSGNGPLGFGWSLSPPAITRKTDKGLPQYRDAEESDEFILSGAEDLVPLLVEKNGNWEREQLPLRTVAGKQYKIQRYRPRIEGLFARIERWTDQADPDNCFWRSISKDNITTWYGMTSNSRIADPSEPSHIFSWLICRSYDDKGNVIVYTYVEENSERIFEDQNGNSIALAHERNRDTGSRSANRYLKRICYGNRVPYLPKLTEAEWPQPPDSKPSVDPPDYYFEAVFDYDDGHYSETAPDADGRIFTRAVCTPSQDAKWPARVDPFSTYRAGFEIRTYRLCQRVLMFHHFPNELGTADYLVRSTDLTYSYENDPASARNPIYSFLDSVTQSGYVRQADGSYLKRSLPPVEFGYTKPDVQDEVKDVDAASLENLPVGLDGSAYQWTDLHGEGIPGILTEQAGSWFYKRNLSPLPVKDDGTETINARFAPLEQVAVKPNLALAGGAQFMDLAGDGQPDLVVMDGPMPGLYEHDEEEGWQAFRPFTARLNRSFRDPNLKFVDLDGDGHADVLITEDDALVWHPSLAEEGFGPARRVSQFLDEEKGPRLIFADGTQSIYLADLSGDGQTDLTRIRNGEVCYWPNLGYGKFGPKVTMDNSPWFDNPDQFDQKRIRLADIDGSGTTDIIYLHRDGVRLYFNHSGNSWSAPKVLSVFPRVNELVSIMPTDLLGNGTACLVWSSPLPGDARRSMRYVSLMGDKKPHLLEKTINNLGAETRVQYAPSTKFYLADKRDGKPWITRLPFPVHCVESVTIKDTWRQTSFSSNYTYHHGYYDGIEREFRGFGRVEQVDVETYGEFAQGNTTSPYISDDKTLYQPPVKTVTWFHTGAFLDRQRILSHYQKDYFPNWLAEAGFSIDPDYVFTERIMPEPDLMQLDLNEDEWREALRACKGMTLRQEVYELDVDALEDGRHVPVKLFTAAGHNCQIRRIQPKGQNKHAVFFATEQEALTYHYELDMRKTTLRPDPRITHTLNLKTNEYGQPQQMVAVAYPRVRPFHDESNTLPANTDEIIRNVQDELHVSYTETRYTNIVESQDIHRLGATYEASTYELTGIRPADESDRQTTDPWDDIYFTVDELLIYRLSEYYQASGLPIEDIPYHQLPNNLEPQKRIVEQVRTLYFKQDLSGPEDLRVQNSLGLVYETYKLALTNDLIDAILKEKLEQVQEADESYEAAVDRVLRSGGFFLWQEAWWMRSGIAGFAADARDHFYLPERYIDPFEAVTTLKYDAYDLYIQSSTDPVGNVTTVERFDCRVLAPTIMKDPNDNLSAVVFDTLGMPVGSATMGKSASESGDTLEDFEEDLDQDDVIAFITGAYSEDQARVWLGNATARSVYYFGEKRETDGPITYGHHPACVAGIQREQHVNQVAVGGESPLHVAFEYANGSGQVLVTKAQAEPENPGGPMRWIASGKTIVNNKSKTVKKYEPYFSANEHRFEEPMEIGVTPVMYYDAVGRLVRTEMPDGSFSRVEFSPWYMASYDQNDTILEPGNEWLSRNTDATASAESRRAAQLTLVHADTPATTYLDSLGREVVAVVHNRFEDSTGAPRDEKYVTFTRLDVEGKPLWIRDARGNRVMQFVMPPSPTDAADDATVGYMPCYDIAGNLLYQCSMDAGDRWMLNDVSGKPLYAWDSRNNILKTAYDALRRPITLELRNGDHPEWIIVGLTKFGEGVPQDKARNVRGKAFQAYDQSGLMINSRNDFKGNALEVRRRLSQQFDSDTDWRIAVAMPTVQGPDALLMSETFVQASEFDALNRVTRQYNWNQGDGSRVAVYELRYNQRGLLVSEDLVVDAVRSATGYENGQRTAAIKRITYNEKGQRLNIGFGNDSTTTYSYDPKTFRLSSLTTERLSDNKTLQDLRYTYDPVGNITEIIDRAVPTVFFNNFQIEARNRYTYDALYRLIEAEGREHAGQAMSYQYDNWHDCSFRKKYQSGDAMAWRNYTQNYSYDPVGNILVMQHLAYGDSANSWTRKYQYAIDSNRLLATGMGTEAVDHYTSTPTLEYRHEYNPHGSMTTMAHLSAMDWDFTEHLRHILRAVGTQGSGADACPDASLEAWYRYDASKQRTRKRVLKQGGLVEERFYFGGLEWYRKWNGSNLLEEIETVHLVDGQQRVLQVDHILKTDNIQQGIGVRYRYQLSNHLGSISLELDEHAQVIACEEYHPFGATSYQAARSQIEARKRAYSGKEKDEESGLSYHGARYYIIWLGCWASCDPLGIAGGLLLYRYAQSNPIKMIDRNGLQPTQFAAGRQAQANLADLLESVNQEIIGYEETLKAGKGGSRADILTRWRSIESKLHDISSKTYRTTGGELNTSALRSVMERDIKQAMKHMEALEDAFSKGNLTSSIENVIAPIAHAKKVAALQETLVVQIANAKNPAEIAKLRAMYRDVARSMGSDVKVGVMEVISTAEKKVQGAIESSNKAVTELEKKSAYREVRGAGSKAQSLAKNAARGISGIGFGIAKDLVAQSYVGRMGKREEILSRDPVRGAYPSSEETRLMANFGYELRANYGEVIWHQSTSEKVMMGITDRVMGLIFAFGLLMDPEYSQQLMYEAHKA